MFYNPSCSGSSDQEDRGSRPAQANSSQDPISKKPNTKQRLVEWLKVKALSLNPSIAKRKAPAQRTKCSNQHAG
jgi:hypothetical protein